MCAFFIKALLKNQVMNYCFCFCGSFLQTKLNYLELVNCFLLFKRNLIVQLKKLQSLVCVEIKLPVQKVYFVMDLATHFTNNVKISKKEVSQFPFNASKLKMCAGQNFFTLFWSLFLSKCVKYTRVCTAHQLSRKKTTVLWSQTPFASIWIV
jgi:hypothetical protein